VILTSIAVVISMLCGVVMAFKNYLLLDGSQFIMIAATVPIISTLVFIIMDVAYISNCRDLGDFHLEQYSRISIKMGKTSKIQHGISNIIYFFSIILIIVSIMMISYMVSNAIKEGIIAYVTVLILGASHLYMTNKKS
jgi:hypothetical protein